METWRWRLPGLVLLSLAVPATVLLIAGYGVPVGVGLLIGLVLGLVVGGVTGFWLSRSGTDRKSQLGPAMAMDEAFRNMERVQRVDHGELVRVVPGSSTADAAGVHLELISLEIRQAGALAHITAAAHPPGGRLGSFPRVRVEDDLGTGYMAAAMRVNETPDRSRFEIRFMPAPAATAAGLRIHVDAFIDPFALESLAPVTGPWVLAVSLA